MTARRQEPSAEDLLEAVLEAIEQPTAVCDEGGVLTFFNRAAAELVGAEWEPVSPALRPARYRLYRPDGALMSAADLPLVRALREGDIEGVEVVIERADGERQGFVASGRALKGPGGRSIGAVVVLREASEALHDTLTGLASRALLADHVRRALERAERHGWATAMLAIDVDQFRNVNDRFGLEAGDRLLVEIARRLQTALRAYDTVARPYNTVARLGGDEFFVLCENVSGAGAAGRIAARLCAAAAEPTVLDGHQLQVTACAGIALERGAATPDALILDAEAAVRRAKQRGPATQEFFAASMRVAVHKRIEDELALRKALDEGQFRLAYQPKVSLATDRITGAEALLRWDDPTRGSVSPSEFIPLAEEAGLIVPIGRWVLEEACRQAARWASAFPNRPALVVSANVSGRQFDSGLVQLVAHALAAARLNPALLCLEVTESTVMTDVQSTIGILGECKELGVGVSVDDFGTGYSSLAYLKRFPLDEVKVDRSFVAGLGRDPEDTAIVAAVMGMAHALELDVVAEGVETEEQLARLRSLGCDLAQGYYFARPGPATATEALLAAEAAASWSGHDAERVADEADPSYRSPTVVVADDAADVRQLARLSLAAAGFEVHEAANGAEAIELVRRMKPDCVVLDVNMGDISGFEVCRVLRVDPAGAACTIVMLTADADAAGKVQGFSSGADDYIVKPFAPRELVQRVQTAMRRRQESPTELP